MLAALVCIRVLMCDPIYMHLEDDGGVLHKITCLHRSAAPICT